MPIRGDYLLSSGNLKDNKELLTVQTLHNQRCKKVMLQVLFRVLILEHEARVVTMTVTGRDQGGDNSPSSFGFLLQARAEIKPPAW